MSVMRSSFWLALLLLPSVSCAGAARYENVMLVGWDGSLRQDVEVLLSSGQLPHLSALAAEGGMTATEVTTGATETKPGWAEILTGRSADEMGIEGNDVYKPVPAGSTVLELLKSRAAGTKTVFLTAKIDNLGARGPHRFCLNCVTRMPPGFEKTFAWDETRILPQTRTFGNLPRRWAPREGEPYYLTRKSLDVYRCELGPADNVGKAALEELDRYGQGRFAVFFHFEDPDEQGHLHGENSPEYSQALRDVDAWLGKLVEKLKALGVYDKTAIFVTTDHGFDRGQRSHRFAPDTFLVTNVHRPLRTGDRKDVTPTILDALGGPAPSAKEVLGRTLFD